MTKINKLHFNGVDYDIGDPEIHDLVEKERFSPTDEFVIADSQNMYQNKKIKASLLSGYESGLYCETIQKGDVINLVETLKDTNEAFSLGATAAGQKIAQKTYGNGKTAYSAYLYLSKQGNGQNITVRIETDNNGEPSGTLADVNATATISASDLTTTLTSTKVEFNGDFILTYGTIYRVVLSVPSVDTSNYINVGKTGGDIALKVYNGANWGLPIGTLQNWTSPGASYSSYKGTLTSTFVLNKDIVVTKLICNPNNYFSYTNVKITDNNTSEVIADSTLESTALVLESGHIYTVVCTLSGTPQAGTIGATTTSWGTFSGEATASSLYGIYMEFGEPETGKTISYGGDFIPNIFCKAYTDKLYTQDNIIGIALNSGVEGDNKYIAISGGIVENDNRDLIPGKKCYFANNIITQDNTIVTPFFIGTAVDKQTIKVNMLISHDLSRYYKINATSYDITISHSGTYYLTYLAGYNIVSGSSTQMIVTIKVNGNTEKTINGQRLPGLVEHFMVLKLNAGDVLNLSVSGNSATFDTAFLKLLNNTNFIGF